LADELQQNQRNVIPNAASSSTEKGGNASPHSSNPREQYHHARALPRNAAHGNRVRQLSVAYQIPGIERLSGRMMLTGPLMSPRADEPLEELAGESELTETAIADPYSPLEGLYGRVPGMQMSGG
jgi:hypothetical protein